MLFVKHRVALCGCQNRMKISTVLKLFWRNSAASRSSASISFKNMSWADTTTNPDRPCIYCSPINAVTGPIAATTAGRIIKTREVCAIVKAQFLHFNRIAEASPLLVVFMVFRHQNDCIIGINGKAANAMRPTCLHGSIAEEMFSN